MNEKVNTTTTIPELPPSVPLEQIETRRVLKKLTTTRAALAELKGVVATIPNEQILIDTLALQEAKDSSEIENIVTTHDELYRSDYNEQQFSTAEAKEVYAYAEGLKTGFRAIREKSLITLNLVLDIQAIIEGNKAGVRKQPGTVLKNDRTGEVIYVPPQEYDTIMKMLSNLEQFINDSDHYEVDPLIKMALIHHQFESIHPFYDGNGRTGRIVNLLYLIKEDLLNLPVLYISRYIIENRAEYYRLLQETRNTGNWEPWVLYMLDAIEETANETVRTVKAIKELMQKYKQQIRSAEPRMYSQDLINNLFRHPYTKIVQVAKDLQVNRLTATKYLERLCEMGMLEKKKKWRSNYYINRPLLHLLAGHKEQSEQKINS